MRILFMGTPEIAADCLSYLAEKGRKIVGAVCQSDKPKGRGNTMTPPPVKILAVSRGISVFQPTTLKDGSFLEVLQETNPDLIVVVAYGKILPEYILRFPKFGCINLHVSLLPAYRGAAPMQRAIMAGEHETGVTVMYMDEGMDTGDIIEMLSYPITESDDYGTVSQKAATLGAPLLSHVIDCMEKGTVTRRPQPTEGVSFAPKIEKAECHIDFSMSAQKIACLIRALSPSPLAFVKTEKGKILKISAAVAQNGVSGSPTGRVLSVSDKGNGEIVIACGEGKLSVSAVVPEGKNRMSAAAFVRGRGIAAGDILL